jgi:hypothetical protein
MQYIVLNILIVMLYYAYYQDYSFNSRRLVVLNKTILYFCSVNTGKHVKEINCSNTARSI